MYGFNHYVLDSGQRNYRTKSAPLRRSGWTFTPLDPAHVGRAEARAAMLGLGLRVGPRIVTMIKFKVGP
jgi:hypothetical protein